MLLRHLRRSSALLKNAVCQTACYSGPFVQINDNKPLFSSKNDLRDLTKSKLDAELHRLETSEIPSFLNDNHKVINDSHLIIAVKRLCGIYKYLPKDMRKGHLDQIHGILEQHADELSHPAALNILRVLWEERVESFFSTHTAMTKKLIVRSLDHHGKTNEKCLQPMLNFMLDIMKGTKYELVQPILQELYGYLDPVSIEEGSSLLRILFLISKSEISFKEIYPEWKVVFDKVQKELLTRARHLNPKQVKHILVKVAEGDEQLRIKFNSRESFYNQNLVEALADKVVADDMGFDTSVSVSVSLRFLRHKNIRLLEYCAKSYYKETRHDGGTIENRMRKLVALVNGLAAAGHRPENWDDITDEIAKSDEIINFENTCLIVLAIDLISLGWYPVHLLEKIFKDPFNYSKFFMRKLTIIYQKLKSDLSYTGPMPSDAQVSDLRQWMKHFSAIDKRSIFHIIKQGTRHKSCFKANITTRLFHMIDYVVGLQQDGLPVSLMSSSLVDKSFDQLEYLEDIKVPDGCQLIPVITFTATCYFANTNELLPIYGMSIESLEATFGYPVAVVNLHDLEKVPKGKKTHFVMDIIRSKLKPANLAITAKNDDPSDDCISEKN